MTKLYRVPSSLHDRINSPSYAGLTGKEGGWQSLVHALQSCEVTELQEEDEEPFETEELRHMLARANRSATLYRKIIEFMLKESQ